MECQSTECDTLQVLSMECYPEECKSTRLILQNAIQRNLPFEMPKFSGDGLRRQIGSHLGRPDGQVGGNHSNQRRKHQHLMVNFDSW
jgi:hypothetical protein